MKFRLWDIDINRLSGWHRLASSRFAASDRGGGALAADAVWVLCHEEGEPVLALAEDALHGLGAE
jgi:hypothetical protein